MPGYSQGPPVITVLIHLPLQCNPDENGQRQDIEDEKFISTAEEICRKFGGALLHKFDRDKPRGFWWDKNVVHMDTVALLEVDIDDTPENRSWLRTYARKVLLERFRQKAIYLKFVPTGSEAVDERVTE